MTPDSVAAPIAVIAGETSGDQLGGWLMAALKRKRSGLRFIGLGGTNMENEGLTSLFPIREISLMGFAEILPHIHRLKRRIHETALFIEREQPKILITIDSPGFAMRVVKQLRKRGIANPKFIHYVAPTVWAYKPERAKEMAKNFDHLLCLLPFEPPYFEAEKLPTSFVGHEIAWWWKTRGDGKAFREKYGIAPNAPLLALFPGSRNGEINRLWPIFSATITRLRAQIPALQLVIQLPPALIPRLTDLTTSWGVKPLILPNSADKKDLFAASTAAIAKSGTIGLECALAGLPSVVAYRANPLTAAAVKRMIRVRYVNLANILADAPIIPELLQENCTPQKIATAILPLLEDDSARQTQRTALADIATMLGTDHNESPSDKAADIILQ